MPSSVSDKVSRQLGRPVREPFRVIRTCALGVPQVIVSPSLLADGSRFPNWAYLTCPALRDALSRRESAGALTVWREAVAASPALRAELDRLDAQVRAARRDECRACGQEEDLCAGTGIGGQRDPSAVKCMHIHAAYALVGLDDPLGARELHDLPEPACLRRGEPCV